MDLSESESRSVQFSCSVVSDSLWTHERKQARPPCPSPTTRVYPNLCPLSWWCHEPSHTLLSPSPPALYLSQHQGLFQWVISSQQVSKVLQLQLQQQSFQWILKVDSLLDVHLYVFWCHILNIYPIVEMLGHRVHMFSFIDIIRRFPKVIIPNSHRQRMRLPFAPILIRLGYC